ncbi:MAG: PSD1 domain-containing protein [Zavarzinella sp.]|nr:PSD1 domain-containing protein [Zavarzinella sp.]
MRLTLGFLFGTLASPVWGGDALPPAASRPVDFVREVRPIFAANCYSCHGETKHKAGLRLDRRPDTALPKIVKAGASGDSRLIHLVAGTNPEAKMPPEGPPLSGEQVGILRGWIDQGAKWPGDTEGHWSLRRLSAPPVPKGAGPAVNPIDAFVRAKLGEKGLSPSPPADRRTLIRRLTFDLHGLPPTPEAIADFVNDAAPDAYERLVDRLLASPHYGERWARHWMDIAHFAETHGHDQDAVREHAWPYRDYLIQSLNADKPYARFIQEQIAGEVLFPGDPAGIVALGFLAAGPWDESSQKDIRDETIDKKAAQYIDRDDMITTVFTAVASTSIHCARCHDHKFDPIPQAEYYGLQAVFAGVDRANRTYDSDAAVAKARRELQSRKADILAGKFDVSEDRAAVEAWEKEAAGRAGRWKPLAATATAKESKVEPQPDGSVEFTGPRPERDTYTFTGTTTAAVTAVRLEVLSDPSLPHKGPGRQDNGNLHLSEVRVHIGDARGTLVPIASAVADFNQSGWDISRAIDGNPATAWGIYPAVGQSHEAVFILKEPIPPGSRMTVELDQLYGEGHVIGRARLSTTSDRNPALTANPIPNEIATILAIPADKRTEAQRKNLAKHVVLTRLDTEIAALPKPQQIYAATTDFETIGNFKPPKGPRPVHMLKRGDVTKPGPEAKPGALSCVEGPAPFAVSDPTQGGLRRAALAKWLTDRENGLVWRSIANRVWHYHFGRGIVNTPNDFGRMGAAPTHPELLDWLAAWFRDSGGSLKALHRLIVTSETYRQSSAHNADYARVDAENACLWRMNRTRLDAESVRDAILSASGLLDPAMGGPSARHFTLAPGVHITPVVEYQKFDVDSPAARRRSVYRFIFRTLPDPFYEALDCPDASQFTPVRAASVTALQALALLNDKFTVRYAEHFAARIEREAQGPEDRIRRAYELALGRPATDAEANRLAAYAKKHGLANACRVLFNCNEFLFVE